MLLLAQLRLEKSDLEALAKLQLAVDGSPSYQAKVSCASEAFDKKPASLFKRVRDGLAVVAGDLVRCAYCEDSCADEVEHVKPKHFYPELVFRSENYLFSCGPCNGGKREKYAVWDGATVHDLIEYRKAHGIVPPPVGQHLFVDPHSQNPLSLIWLDIAGGTFHFTPLDDDVDGISYRRADTTIRYLRLNKQVLVRARSNAYGGFRDRLAQYVHRKQAGAPQAELDNRVVDLMRTPHRTVWEEMKRQSTQLAEVGQLLAAAPEATTWTL